MDDVIPISIWAPLFRLSRSLFFFLRGYEREREREERKVKEEVGERERGGEGGTDQLRLPFS